MQVRVKKNPRLDPVFERGGYTMCYRAEYQNPDGKWYPCYDRRYNQTKRKAGNQARAYLAAHPSGPQKKSGKPPESFGTEEMTFSLAGWM